MMKESPPEPDTTARIQAQIARMDALLAAGQAAVAKLDRFYEEHGIRPGIGAEMLDSDHIPDRHRIIFARILAELPRINQGIEELEAARQKPTPLPVSARAVGNRYRI